MEYQEALWGIYVQEGVTFADWLYGRGAGNEEDRRRLQEVMSKKGMIISDRKECVVENTGIRNIDITLGQFQTGVSEVKEYIRERREVLSSIKKCNRV